MVNPILQTLNQSKMAPVRNMIQSMKNPAALMNQLSKNNPQFSQVMNLIQQNGGDAKKAFYSYANQMGVNGDEIIKMLNGK